jgi:GT2 family glycosyltransferase
MRSGEHRAEFINTVCCLVKQSRRDVGLMDENIGIYFDDAEWMTRAEERDGFLLCSDRKHYTTKNRSATSSTP